MVQERPVLDEWGIGGSWLPPWVTVLFAGSPGTGNHGSGGDGEAGVRSVQDRSIHRDQQVHGKQKTWKDI
jgi:hypothetical protein